MTEQNAPLILVVDDYQDAREMYAEYLQFSGFRVAEARNGNEAVEQAFALLPDRILMDLSLPGKEKSSNSPGPMSPIVLTMKPTATAIPNRSPSLPVKRNKQKYSFR